MIGPRAFDAAYLLIHQDDPVELADHLVAASLSPAVAKREIEAALAANDPELAASFVELAGERGVAIEADLAQRVEAANSTLARAKQAAGSFASGFVTGEPEGRGRVRRHGHRRSPRLWRYPRRHPRRRSARGGREQADELVLGLACVGLAVTAGTYASLRVGAPARVGVSIIKAARKAGQIGGRLAAVLGRMLRSAVDLTAVSPVSLTQPATALRAAREAVKFERAGGLVRLMEDTGRIQAKAGTRAAMDGLKIADEPKDIARVARLAEAKGGKTRAILKLSGRAAIALALGAFNLASWAVSALAAIIGFCAAVKGLTERTTRRWLAWREARRTRLPVAT